VALCIGNGAYGRSDTLSNCVHDAEDMGACAGAMGFDFVHVLRDATKEETRIIGKSATKLFHSERLPLIWEATLGWDGG
jgi:uncharacterized caspase-like protein